MTTIKNLSLSLFLLLPVACVGQVMEGTGDDTGDDDALPQPDAGAEPDAPPAVQTYNVSGVTQDYSALDPLPQIALATEGMTPPMQAESDMAGAYTLAGVPAGNAFLFRAMPSVALPNYLPTTNPAITVLDQNLTQNVFVVSQPYNDRQYATANVLPLPNTSLVVSSLENLDGTPWAGVPLTGIKLVAPGSLDPVGDGPYVIGVNGDVDLLLLESVAYVDRGARIAFLNVPTGQYTIEISYIGPNNAEIKASGSVLSYDNGATIARVIHDPANDGGGTPSFTTDIYPILQKASQGGQDCASCHTAGGVGAVLIMNDGAAAVHARLLAAPGVVNLLAPAESLLLTKPLYEDPPNHPNATWLDITNPYYIKVLLWIQGGAPL